MLYFSAYQALPYFMSKKPYIEPKAERVDRQFVPDLLARKYMKDYEACLVDFPDSKKIDLLEHLLGCLDIFERYVADPTPENWKTYSDKEDAFLKTHGNRLQKYYQKKIPIYYGGNQALVEKEIYTVEEWNELGIRQKLSPEEFAHFIPSCRRVLQLDKHFLLLYQAPEDEKVTEKITKENLSGIPNVKDGKIKKRGAQDNLTRLTQEQTVLFTHFLQKERFFLDESNIQTTDLGKAIEILTGYSQHTIRQDFKKFKTYHTKINLKEISDLLTKLQMAVNKAYKEIDHPPA
jgi:hypothetical protein